jgi:hypothetical protein
LLTSQRQEVEEEDNPGDTEGGQKIRHAHALVTKR